MNEKIKFGAKMFGLVAGVITVPVLLTFTLDGIQRKKDAEYNRVGANAYQQLRNVADTDNDGKLSIIETTLMLERLDKNIRGAFYMQVPQYPWTNNFVGTNTAPKQYDYNVLKRIHEAIEMYKK